MDPAEYEAWYHTERGNWIAAIEWKLLLDLMQPHTDATLLDVGCGTGYFTRRFAELGLSITAMDPNRAVVSYARQQDGSIDYLQANALSLPFTNDSFDYASAITSLCFVAAPQQALQEMWRVTRQGLLLGLLNKNSLLYWEKRYSRSYKGARWDRIKILGKWVENLEPKPIRILVSNGVLLANKGKFSTLVENTLGNLLPFGAFIAMYIEKSTT